MLIQPRKFKFSKTHKQSFNCYDNIHASKINMKFCYGSVALYAKTSGYISPQQVESIRKIFNRMKKKTFFVWVRGAPFIAKTAKPLESRMGKGRGKTVQWLLFVKKGQILFEIESRSNFKLYKKNMINIQSKLPIKLSIKHY